MEVHLHHDNDTAENLRRTLLEFKRRSAERHGLLSRDRETGEVVYGFIHGNWALDNSRPDGRWCGVNNELDVLRETGCYADFTLPSAPSETQTRKINSIYWAVDDPRRPKSHDTGTDLGTAPAAGQRLLMIQGPLLLDWSRRKWGLPEIENALPPEQSAAELDATGPVAEGVRASPDPAGLVLREAAHTRGQRSRTRTCSSASRWCGSTRCCGRAERDPLFRFHYVTAREMANIALAAAEGSDRSIQAARSFRYVPLG